jgi:hypothetical protein
MAANKKPPAPIRSTIVLIIFVAFVFVIAMVFLEIQPVPLIKTAVRRWAQNIQIQAQQLFQTEKVLPISAGQDVTSKVAVEVKTQTLNNWEYTLTKINWRDKNKLEIQMNIRNIGNQTLPFGFSYPVSDESFTTVYKLCVQNSSKQVYWDISQGSAGAGFYNRYFSPGEVKTGTLNFNIDSDSQKLYLCLSVGGNVANRLFYLGNPE